MKRLTLLASLLLATSPATAQQVTYVSIASGSWTQASTWAGGRIPTPTDNVLITSGHRVWMPSWYNAKADNITVQSGATLETTLSLSHTGVLTNHGTLVSNLNGSFLGPGSIANHGVLNFAATQGGNWTKTVNSDIHNSGTINWSAANIRSTIPGGNVWMNSGTYNRTVPPTVTLTNITVTTSACPSSVTMLVTLNANKDVVILDGQTVTSTDDGTYIEIPTGYTHAQSDFNIYNESPTSLPDLLNVQDILTSNTADFQIEEFTPGELAVGDMTPFIVGFVPTAGGVRTTTITIKYNDCRQFTFAVKGQS